MVNHTPSFVSESARFARFSLRGLLAAGLVGTLFFACTGEDKEDPTLYTPRSVLLDTGMTIYNASCNGCHGEFGEGSRQPKVANSSFVMDPANRERMLRLVLQGAFGEGDTIYVNGVPLEVSGMPAWGNSLTNLEIAGALTYIRAVLTDTLVTDCEVSTNGQESPCVRTPRDSLDIATDSIAVWEVKAVRDTIIIPEPQ